MNPDLLLFQNFQTGDNCLRLHAMGHDPCLVGKVSFLVDTNLLTMALSYFQNFLHIIQYLTRETWEKS